MTMTAVQAHPLDVGDVIEFQPRFGRPRIIEVTATHGHGFDGVLTGNRLVKTFGYYAQVTRVLRRDGMAENVVHKTRTVEKQRGIVVWACACEHTDTGVGETDEEAMRDARLQQRHHYDEVRGMVS